MKPLTLTGFFLRLASALMLVGLSYNPSGYSYYHWLVTDITNFGPLLALAGISLLIAWVIFIRATLRSLGAVGLTLAAAFFASLVWLFIDLGWFSLEQPSMLGWLLEVILAIILALGLSWSHIRRRLSGQVDTDDVEES